MQTLENFVVIIVFRFLARIFVLFLVSSSYYLKAVETSILHRRVSDVRKISDNGDNAVIFSLAAIIQKFLLPSLFPSGSGRVP